MMLRCEKQGCPGVLADRFEQNVCSQAPTLPPHLHCPLCTGQIWLTDSPLFPEVREGPPLGQTWGIADPENSS